MSGAYQLARIAGIPVKVHWTFGLLLIWVVYAAVSAGMTAQGTLLSLAVIGVVFLCVILHEFGHALTARTFGIHTHDIILSPIGGVARLDNIPDRPREEILIALAGPAVNLVIAGAILLYARLFTPYWIDLTSPYFWMMNYAQPVIIIIAKINLILLFFNMIPAFPMDGGRVLRAALSTGMDRIRATRYAAFLGQVIGLGLFSAALFELIFNKEVIVAGWHVSDLILGIIGVFVFTAARREVKAVEYKSKLRSHRAMDIMTNVVPTVIPASTSLSSLNLDISQDSGLLIGSSDRVDGILFTEYLDQARSMGDPEQQVGSFMSDVFEPIESNTDLATLIDIFRERGYRLCPVFAQGQLVGTISRSQLIDFISKHAN